MSLLPKGAVDGLTEKSSQPQGSRKFNISAEWSGKVDLDLVAAPVRNGVVDTNDVVYFGRRDVFSGAFQLSPDSLTGGKETMIANLDSLPADVSAIVLGVISYSAKDMSQAYNTKFVIRDGAEDSAPMLYEMPIGGDDIENETILFATNLIRNGADWDVQNVAKLNNEFPNGMAALQGFVAKAPSIIA